MARLGCCRYRCVILEVVESFAIGALAIGFGGLVLAAANGRLKLLVNPLIVWLGSISYTLYLLHENIGWSIILALLEAGVGANFAIVVAIASTLTLASVVTRMVEKPMMSAIRTWYRQTKTCAVG